MEESGQKRDEFEEKIETCMHSYKKDHGKLPSLAILSGNAKSTLSLAGLLEIPSFISSIHVRDAVVGKNFRLDVYDVDELSAVRRLEVKKIFSWKPGTLYLGRTTWWGLGNKVREESLEWYNFRASSGALAQT
ncbi:hypothetical protein A3K73_02220 [Candidatus Pacearchaeota archaeon RBG_13_36_9]|nr:MAG: hypothetical protein A3K73_02220 [Candidatus Pacearchaeota archaeon RBG_13_36_9]